LFANIIENTKIDCFTSTLHFISCLKNEGVKIAVISSSKNCKRVLNKAGIENLFSVRVDGETTEELGLLGKPEPDIFLQAAKQLKVKPQECLIVEDALAGIKGAKKGGFGLVIAIDRKKILKNEFINHKADIIVNDLSEIHFEKFKQSYLYSLQKFTCKEDYSFSFIKNLTVNKKIVIVLDYDGTLTPIVDKPELALLSAPMKQTLEKLSTKYLIYIISGRQLLDIKQKVGINSIYYSGNHGLEFEGPCSNGEKFELGKKHKEQIEKLHLILKRDLQNINGCLVENKKFSLAIHYRLVKQAACINKIRETIDKILKDFPGLKRIHGKKVFEIRPNINWDKGMALAYFLKKRNLTKNNCFPIYIGDDEADEAAFKAINDYGISIKIADMPQKTNADFFLKNVNDVWYFLNSL
jgi:alpha,alpha-trehalase